MESRTLLSITVDMFSDVVDAADGFTSLREAIAQAALDNGDETIALPHEIDGIDGTYILSAGVLSIDDADAVTIQSEGGPATIDAQGASQVFLVSTGSNVTLQGLTITGGSSPDPATGSGGGVQNDGTIVIADCTFTGNSAGFIGGGLYNSGLGTATVTGCTFEGNASTYGGGFNNQGTATVTGCTFRNNTAGGNSGGLDNIGTVSVFGSLFEGNSAVSYGGAVNVYGGFVGFPGTTVLEGCTFRNNSSSYVAGGVQISETTGTVTDCIFEGNSAVYGGGLSNSGTTTITGGEFRNNTASGNGGGVESIGTVTIIGTLFEQDTASQYGGGVHTYGGFAGFPGALTVTDATIRDSSAYFGGGISFEVAQASVTGTLITGNSASYGGGLYNQYSNWSMDNSAVEDNTALYSGGGLLNDYSNGSATIVDSSFANNTALYGGGGGIFNNYGASMAVTRGNLTGNLGSNGGGIINYGTTSVDGSLFTGNTGLYGGGGIYNANGNVRIAGSTLASNSAPGNAGGGLYSSYGTVTATDSTFNANSTGSYGGGVYISGGTATIGDSTLSNNTASFSGGGIFAYGYGGITIYDNLISNNQGCGIDSQGYYTLLESNTIIDNSGDGVRIDGGSYNTIGTPDAGNIITGNTGAGVAVVGYAFDNTIRGNIINSNGGPAIDLGGDGRTVNDLGDIDSGPNYLLNYPVITGFATGATTHVTGTLSSSPNPNTTFTIDVYPDSSAAPINPGESYRYLGSFQVTTDGLGNATFDATLAAATAPGEIVTATATDQYGSTSEFSDLNFVKVSPISGLYTSESGAKASFSVVLTSPPTADVTIPLSSSNTAEGTVSPASLTFTSANWNVPQVVTVTGVDDAIADGPISYTIVTGPAISTDPIFSGMDGDDVQVTNFDHDFASLAAIQPQGSLIYDAALDGVVGSGGGTENYSLLIDPGQKITVVVDPEGTDLKATIQLFQSGKSTAIGTATAGAAGQEAVLETIATQGQLGGDGPGPKTYQIRVSGAAATTGLYHVRIILNAALENESHDGAANDTRAAAQSLEPSFLPLNGSVDDPPKGSYAGHGAVLGRTDASTPDYYAVSLAKGESATLALTGLSSGGVTLALEDSTGTTLAVGRGFATNLGQVIDNFSATKAGTYYLRVTGSTSDGTDYSLVVTRNADFDTEANDLFATAQDLVSPESDGRRWVMGAIVPSDTYVASAQSYNFEDISGTGHAILQGTAFSSQWLSSADLNGFQFTLYGSMNDNLYVGSSGYLSLPANNGTVFAMYRDLAIYGSPDSAVYWQVLGEGNSQRLVVQWNDVGFYYDPGADPITFEVVLSETDGSVQFNYRDLQTDVWYLNEGLYTTIGISGYPNGSYDTLFLPTFDAPNQFVGTGRSTKISQPPGLDDYRITVDANSTLEIETETPGSQSGEFTNTLDPIVRLYDSAGNLVAWDDNGASDGLNAKLSYKVPKGKGGTYYIQVDASPATATPTEGEYILTIKKATGALPAFQVANTDVPDGTRYRYSPTSIQIDFNDVLLLTTLQASDLKVDGLTATGYTVVDGDTVRFDLPGGLPDGTHTVAIAAGAMQDIQGTNLAAFTEHFSTDQTPPRVIASSIQQDDVLSPGDLTYTITFNEPMNTANLDVYDFSLVGQFGYYPYPGSFAYDAAGTTLTLRYSALPEDDYTLTLFSGDGQFEDLVGNNLDGEPTAWPIPTNQSGDGVEGGNFSVSFSVDVGTFSFPTPLAPELPSGSLVYDRSLSGAVNAAGDTDSFTIALDPGQTLTVFVFAYGQASLQSTVEVRDHSGTLLGSAVAVGQEAVVQTVPITAADTYTITVGGAAGSTGTYALTLFLNAALELEPIGVPGDNTIADAQNIDASFTDLIKGATRSAVLGASGDTDLYSFQLQAGQALSADLVFHDAIAPQVFGPRTNLYEYTPAWVALGDVNSDGILDMVDASLYGSNLTVRLGNGDGTFGAPSTFGFGSASPMQVALADLNGDGNLDVVSSNYYGGDVASVTVMMGHGDGTFDEAVGYSAGYYNVGIALGDFNGDARPDIVTTSLNDSTVRVLLNNGDGTFGTAASYGVGYYPSGVAVGDFNGDGALDIVTADFYGNTATILLNNGDGTFGTGVSYFAGYSADGVAVGDFNGDGAPDIAVTNYYYGTVSVLMNNGDGTFGAGVPYAVGGYYNNSVAVGDLNGDGKTDIVVGSVYDSSFSAGNVSVLLNNGDGTFGGSQNSSSGYNTNAVALGDLNGDGLPDLVTANLYGYSLSVFLNQSQATTLDLIAPDGVTVLASAEATDNVQAAFSNFIATDAGTYYLRISGPPTVRFYTLVVNRDAVFDLGGNDTRATAQPLDPVHVALGYVAASDDPSDVYSFTATAGQVIHLYTTTPGDGPGEFVNTLNPHLRLFDALGTLVAEGVPSADGRNEDITYTAADAGTYFVEVSAEGGTSGEYLLDPSPVEGVVPPAALPPMIESPVTSRSEIAGPNFMVAAVLAAVATPDSGPTSGLAVAPLHAGVQLAVVPTGRRFEDGRGSALPLPRRVSDADNRRAPAAMAPGEISALRTSNGPHKAGYASFARLPLRGPAPRGVTREVEHNEIQAGDLFIPVSVGGGTPAARRESEGAEVQSSEAASALAWDTCLADEDWTSSLIDRGGQALMGSAAVLAALNLYKSRRRKTKRLTPQVDNHWALQLDARPV